MHILMISIHDIWGSLDSFSPMKEILLFLGNNNVTVDFISLDKPAFCDKSSEIYGAPVDFIHKNVIIHRIKILESKLLKPLYKVKILDRLFGKLRREILFGKKAYNSGKKIIKEKDVDIVYAYEIFGVKTAKKLSDKYHLPLVTRFQGSFLYDWEKRFGEDYCRRKYKLHYKALSTPSDLLIMTNDGTQGDRILQKLGNAENMRFWRNGFDFKPLPQSKEELRLKLGLDEKMIYTVSVCRLAYWKRLERIVEAYRVIAEKRKNIKHIFVGEGDKRSYLEGLIKDYGLEEFFLFVGDTAHDKVPEYLQASDVFLSFFDSTNVGNPLLEAVKINMPIVTYDVGDTSVIINGENGVLLDEPTPQKICGAVLEIIDDKEYRLKMISNVKETSKLLWTWQDRLKAEYDELINLTGGNYGT